MMSPFLDYAEKYFFHIVGLALMGKP